MGGAKNKAPQNKVKALLQKTNKKRKEKEIQKEEDKVATNNKTDKKQNKNSQPEIETKSKNTTLEKLPKNNTAKESFSTDTGTMKKSGDDIVLNVANIPEEEQDTLKVIHYLEREGKSVKLKILTPEGFVPDIDTSTAIPVDRVFPQYREKKVRKKDVANKKLIMDSTTTCNAVLNLGEEKRRKADQETSKNNVTKLSRLSNVIKYQWKTLKPPREELEVLEIECCMREIIDKYKVPTSLVYMPVEIEGVIVPACVDSGCGVPDSLITQELVKMLNCDVMKEMTTAQAYDGTTIICQGKVQLSLKLPMGSTISLLVKVSEAAGVPLLISRKNFEDMKGIWDAWHQYLSWDEEGKRVRMKYTTLERRHIYQINYIKGMMQDMVDLRAVPKKARSWVTLPANCFVNFDVKKKASGYLGIVDLLPASRDQIPDSLVLPKDFVYDGTSITVPIINTSESTVSIDLSDLKYKIDYYPFFVEVKDRITRRVMEQINYIVDVINSMKDEDDAEIVLLTNEANQSLISPRTMKTAQEENGRVNKTEKILPSTDHGRSCFPTDKSFIPSVGKERTLTDNEKRKIISEALGKDKNLSRFNKQERRNIVQRLQKTIFNNLACMYFKGDPLPKWTGGEVHIPMKPNTPRILEKQRPTAKPYRQEAERILGEAENNGLIEELKRNDWDCCLAAAGFVFKPKRYDMITNQWVTAARMYVDYRKINPWCEEIGYDLPSPDDLFSYLAGAKYFITIDLKGFFPSLKLDEESARTFAFSCNNKRYKSVFAREGIKVLPIIASNILNEALDGLVWKKLLTYVDDILILGKTVEECLDTFEKTLERLKNEGFKIVYEKCDFFPVRFKWLGIWISEDGLEIHDKYIAAVQELEFPENGADMGKFLGLCSWLSRWLQYYAVISKPLYKLVAEAEKTKRYNPTELHRECFEKLKQQIVSPLVLAHYDAQKPLFCMTDTSGIGIGGCLLQREDNAYRPIAFASYAFRDSEYRTYGGPMLEVLGGVYMLTKRFKLYTYHNKQVYWLTDHRNVTSFLQPTARKQFNILYRWMYALNEIPNLAIIPTRANYVKITDTLSRLSTKTDVNDDTEEEFDAFVAGLNENALFGFDPEIPTNVHLSKDDEEKKGAEVQNVLLMTTLQPLLNMQLTEQCATGDNEPGQIVMAVIDSEKEVDNRNMGVPEVAQVVENARNKRNIATINLNVPVPIDRPQRDQELKKYLSQEMMSVIEWLQENQENDVTTGPLYREAKANEGEELPHPRKKDWLFTIRYCSHGEKRIPLLLIRPKVRGPAITNMSKIMVPSNLEEAIIRLYHEQEIHVKDPRSLVATIARTYFIEDLEEKVKAHTEKCLTCEASQPVQHTVGLLDFDFAEVPFGVVNMDRLFMPEDEGYKSILAMTDRFSAYLITVPLRTKEMAEAVKAIENHLILKHMPPLAIRADGEFDNTPVKELCEMYGIDLEITPAYDSKANGLAERTNREIREKLRRTLLDQELKKNLHINAFLNPRATITGSWVDKLGYVTFFMNNTVRPTRGVAPNEVILGMRVKNKLERMLQLTPYERKLIDDGQGLQPYQKELVAKLHEVFKLVREKLSKRSEYYAKHYNDGRKEVGFRKGDRVMVYNPNLIKYAKKNRWETKARLLPGYIGPFVVEEELPRQFYIVKEERTGTVLLDGSDNLGASEDKPLKMHVGHLRPYRAKDLPTEVPANPETDNRMKFYTGQLPYNVQEDVDMIRSRNNDETSLQELTDIRTNADPSIPLQITDDLEIIMPRLRPEDDEKVETDTDGTDISDKNGENTTSSTTTQEIVKDKETQPDQKEKMAADIIQLVQDRKMTIQDSHRHRYLKPRPIQKYEQPALDEIWRPVMILEKVKGNQRHGEVMLIQTIQAIKEGESMKFQVKEVRKLEAYEVNQCAIYDPSFEPEVDFLKFHIKDVELKPVPLEQNKPWHLKEICRPPDRLVDNML